MELAGLEPATSWVRSKRSSTSLVRSQARFDLLDWSQEGVTQMSCGAAVKTSILQVFLVAAALQSAEKVLQNVTLSIG
jgi:hypothetical protein